jgi:hypothetical protein
MLALASLVGACASSNGVTLPPLPPWQTPNGATALPSTYIVAETRAKLPGVIVNYADNTYTVVSYAWLDAFIDWTWHAAKAAGISYTPESFDCDNFTDLFVEIASLAAAKAGIRSQPLVARVLVQLDANTRHELAGVVTDRGVFIVEPQPDAGPFRKWKLDAYPAQIISVTFGAYNRPW